MPIASLQMLKARFTPPEYGNFGSGNKCYFNYDLVTDDDSYATVLRRWLKSNQIPEPTYLDLGCGNSRYLKNLLGNDNRIVHADLSSEGIRNTSLPLVCDLREPLPLPSSCLNGIHCKDVITHVPLSSRDQLFSEMRRVIEPTGIGVLLTSAEIGYRNGEFNERVDYEAIINQLERSGFEVDDFDTWIPDYPRTDWYYRSPRPMPRFVLVGR